MSPDCAKYALGHIIMQIAKVQYSVLRITLKAKLMVRVEYHRNVSKNRASFAIFKLALA